MSQRKKTFRSLFQRFAKDDRGITSIEFVLVFPIFFGIFLMTFESGMISLRHVMLERGVDFAIRDVRIGTTPDPDRDILRQKICEVSRIIPDCERQLEIELLQRDPLAWTAVPTEVQCVDRGDLDRPPPTFDGTGNNMLMFMRACVRIDPFLTSPIYGLIGRAITDGGAGDSAAGGSYALVSTGAFVVEPFRVEEDDT